MFVYQRGSYYQTSIALDDIRLRPGACRMIPFAPPKRDAIKATTKPIVITTTEKPKPGGESNRTLRVMLNELYFQQQKHPHSRQ